MKSSYQTATLAATIASLLFSFTALAREHDAFNGTWTLVPARSTFGGQPVLQSGTVTISDHEGNTNVTRNFVYDGAGKTYFYNDTVSSEHNATIHEGPGLKSKTTWDHDMLRVTTTQPGGVTTETYALGGDGSMTVTVAKPDHPPFTLFFERK